MNNQRKNEKSLRRKCCSKTSIRRLVRIMYLFGIICVIILVPYFVLSQIYSSKTLEFAETQAITINLHNCKFLIEEESPANGLVNIRVEVAGT